MNTTHVDTGECHETTMEGMPSAEALSTRRTSRDVPKQPSLALTTRTPQVLQVPRELPRVLRVLRLCCVCRC